MNLGINLNRSCHVISSFTDPVSACQGTFQETAVDHRYCWVGLPDIVASQKAGEIPKAMNISETRMQKKIRKAIFYQYAIDLSGNLWKFARARCYQSTNVIRLWAYTAYICIFYSLVAAREPMVK